MNRFQLRLGRWRAGLEWRAILICDSLVLCLSSPKTPGGDVVIVKLDAIGDFVLWLDAAKELKQLYPDRKITLLANSIWAELAEKIPYWDEVWPVNVSRLKRNSFYRARFLRAVRERGFELAIQPTHSREVLLGDALVRASGARERIGSVGDCNNMGPRQKAIADTWYTRQLQSSQNPMMELERNAEFIRLLGRKDFAAAYPKLFRLAELPEHIRMPDPYLILFPGASANLKQWPAYRFAETANHLCSEMGLAAVVCGSADESVLCQRVAENIKVRAVNLAGQTSLPDLVELVRGARLLIGNDTSAVHVAAAVGTPAVCILGGGHYGRFMPYIEAAEGRAAPEPALHRMPCFGCKWRCTQPHSEGGPVPCISGVSVMDVLRASERAVAAVSVRIHV